MENKKFTSTYKRGFKEGFNNPNSHKVQITNFLEKGRDFPNEKAKEYFEGVVFGVATKEKERREGKNRFIMSDKDLKEVKE
jgi:hypothetical protein